MDEVVIMIRGKKHWLWRAIDANGDVLDILVQSRRNAKAARRFFQGLTERFGEPRVVITDKLRSYIVNQSMDDAAAPQKVLGSACQSA